MSDMVYAVHTRTCTYLLDEEGVCGWVLSPAGDTTQDRCIGAQFVACLDLNEEGGLVGELRVGAAGLFTRRERGRFVLLRTSTIEHVDYRRTPAEDVDIRDSSADLSVTAALPDVGEMDARIEAARMNRAHREVAAAAAAAAHEGPPETQRLQHDAQHAARAAHQERSAASFQVHPSAHQTAPPPPLYAHGQHMVGPPDPYAAADVHAYQQSRIDDPVTGPMPPGFDADPYARGAAAQQAGAWPAEPPMVTPEQLTASSEELDIADLDELSTFSSEVTLTIPLYRPEPDEPAPRWGGAPPPAAWPAAGAKHRR